MCLSNISIVSVLNNGKENEMLWWDNTRVDARRGEHVFLGGMEHTAAGKSFRWAVLKPIEAAVTYSSGKSFGRI